MLGDPASKAWNVRAWNRNCRCAKRTDTGLLCANGLQKVSFSSAHGVFRLLLLLIFLNGAGEHHLTHTWTLCYDAVQIWQLVKQFQISNSSTFVFTWLLLNISLAKELLLWLPKAKSLWSNQTTPSCPVIECSKHSLFSDPFICWAFWFGSPSYAWEILSGVLGFFFCLRIRLLCWCDLWPAFSAHMNTFASEDK